MGMVEHVKKILGNLKLPWIRMLRLCGGDLGFTRPLLLFWILKCFLTAQDRWLEISSVSNFETYQAID